MLALQFILFCFIFEAVRIAFKCNLKLLYKNTPEKSKRDEKNHVLNTRVSRLQIVARLQRSYTICSKMEIVKHAKRLEFWNYQSDLIPLIVPNQSDHILICYLDSRWHKASVKQVITYRTHRVFRLSAQRSS